MSNTKREPLLSDRNLWDRSAEIVRDLYEAARAKDAELIQQLVDGLHKVATLADVDTDDRSTIARDPLYAAKAAGFKPSDQRWWMRCTASTQVGCSKHQKFHLQQPKLPDSNLQTNEQ
jgi:hypothetical protein